MTVCVSVHLIQSCGPVVLRPNSIIQDCHGQSGCRDCEKFSKLTGARVAYEVSAEDVTSVQRSVLFGSLPKSLIGPAA